MKQTNTQKIKSDKKNKNLFRKKQKSHNKINHSIIWRKGQQ